MRLWETEMYKNIQTPDNIQSTYSLQYLNIKTYFYLASVSLIT